MADLGTLNDMDHERKLESALAFAELRATDVDDALSAQTEG